MLDQPMRTPADIATDLQLGTSARERLSSTFERNASTWRVWLLNNDESGSMEKQLHQNALAFDKVASLLGDRADAIIAHGFGYDSFYQIFAVPALAPLFKKVLAEGKLKGEVAAITSNAQTA